MAAIVLGTEAGGEPVAISFFTAERATHVAAIGDPALPKLLALRALSTGAGVQVVTSRPEKWLRLRGSARRPAERMAIVPPGTPPPTNATQAAPWMIIHDSAAEPTPVEPAPVGGPWQAVVAVPGPHAVTVAALRGLDAVILYRSIPAWRAAVVGAMNLPVPAALSLHGIPRDVVVVASTGTVKLVPLTPDASESALLDQSVHAHPPVPVSVARPAARRRAGLGLRIWRRNDYRLVPGLTRVSFDTKSSGAEGEVA